ncbi:unnamed protein product [Arctogadus glacialis]
MTSIKKFTYFFAVIFPLFMSIFLCHLNPPLSPCFAFLHRLSTSPVLSSQMIASRRCGYRQVAVGIAAAIPLLRKLTGQKYSLVCLCERSVCVFLCVCEGVRGSYSLQACLSV